MNKCLSCGIERPIYTVHEAVITLIRVKQNHPNLTCEEVSAMRANAAQSEFYANNPRDDARD